MTKSGFDLDDIERRLMLHDPAWWRMNTPTLTAYEIFPAMLTEIRELRAENARLKEALDEDGLAEIITDTLDIDWQPRWAAQAIRRAALGEPQ